MNHLKYLITAILLGYCSLSYAQAPAKPTAIDIYNKIEKLNFLGTALYFAAHPDDENTRIISYLSNELDARTGYLSLTRGDGGQNLIGTGIREELGLIRTHELLGARSIDGGEQFFTRANDFGFSKHPDETLAIWNKEEVMHDIIKVIRTFKPDIVINRFDHNSAGRTHGHHTSSAMLSVEAFDLAADEEAYAERLGKLEPWKIRRTFFNTSWWFYGSREKFAEADKSKMLSVDVGVYYPDRGLSNTEIASLSRSMHKSQGFGSTGTRGSSMEFLELIKGDLPVDKENLFDGINTTWTRVSGGAPIKDRLDKLINEFNYQDPASHLNELTEIYGLINAVEDDHWRKLKAEECKAIIKDITGLYLEATVSDPILHRGGTYTIDVEAINRSSADITLSSMTIGDSTYTTNRPLSPNTEEQLTGTVSISTDHLYSTPYWLRESGTEGMYQVSRSDLISRPENPAVIPVQYILSINNVIIPMSGEVVHKYNDPVHGEVYEPIAVLPAASVAFSDPVYVFGDRTPKSIRVNVTNYQDSLNGKLSLSHSPSWIVTPESIDVQLRGKGAQESFVFQVKGPYLQESSEMGILLSDESGNLITDQEVVTIDHDHIPKQYIIKDANASFERVRVEKKGDLIAYVQGAGDEIPQCLRQIGYIVEELAVEDINSKNLALYDAVVIGIRAYNTKKDLFLKKEVLNEYMTNGGTVVVQYNTNRGVKGDDIAPYPLRLSRDRVTDETAKVSYVDADHEVLNYPNKITNRDFNDWVQERGLYFPDEWDARYASPLACNDPGETMKKGSLLIAPVGEGHFVYTGLSWFRQLPAGVPGAYRLFANILSIGKNGVNVPSGTTQSNE